MDRLRKLFAQDEVGYEPINTGTGPTEHESLPSTPSSSTKEVGSFRSAKVGYAIYLLMGVSMLWAWNMFLAAGPYFRKRFRTSDWILVHFQAVETSVSTIINLVAVIALTFFQSTETGGTKSETFKFSYVQRIFASLVLNALVFLFLSFATLPVFALGAESYFSFLICMVLLASLATGLCQNGLFAYVSGYSNGVREVYTQAIMAGQAVAGVLPAIVEICTAASRRNTKGSGKVLAYFATAVGVEVAAFFGFAYLLLSTHKAHDEDADANTPTMDGEVENEESAEVTSHVPIFVLWRKLSLPATAIFLTFGITMVFPVFTERIHSNNAAQEWFFAPPEIFIPLAYLFWNTGDLLGRLFAPFCADRFIPHPGSLLLLAASRIVFVGLYLLCNIRGHGAVVKSDFFYLVVVQALFGASNGFLGALCMMGVGTWVGREERSAAGAFMSLAMVVGLASGSLTSFAFAAS
ncbi:nucleoside transporter family [Piedraia hortae CBS 480.64]|uniref:Nucleoside transporter family n=1 Tax=Piedraia hortae CBS 480.64 TaxID=1314780 RepID=A0A6A7C4Q5_9PEZI|nr:nucleoside transporter family [Piedraia hortae CBS 480.64]